MKDTFKNKLIKIIAIVIEVLYAIGVFNIISNFNKPSKNNGDSLVVDCISIFMFVLYTYIIGRKIFFKKNSNAMRAMKNFTTYENVQRLIKNEEFKEIKNCGEGSVYASKLWLMLDGVLIPKNFIAGAYVQVGTYGAFILHIILINGKQIFYRIGSDANKVHGAVRTIKKIVPHMRMCDDLFRSEKHLFRRIEKNYMEKTKDGLDIEHYIKNWTSDFEVR